MSAPFGKNALTFSDVVKQLRTTFETFSDLATKKKEDGASKTLIIKPTILK